MTEYRILLFRCPQCNRPIPAINTGHLPHESLEIACLERLACQWAGKVLLSNPEQLLTVNWSDKKPA